MFVRHKVEDYAKWRSVYDAFDATRRSVGVKAQSVCRAVGNPSDVTVTHDFDTAEKAKAFVESSELHKAMYNAGVAGPPEIWITSRHRCETALTLAPNRERPRLS
jgi:hypothetical protein